MLPELEHEVLYFLHRVELDKYQFVAKHTRDLVDELSSKLALHPILEMSAGGDDVTIWMGSSIISVAPEEIDEKLPSYLRNSFVRTLEITWLTDWYFLFIWQAHWQNNSFLNKVIMPLGDRGQLPENQWALEFFSGTLGVSHYSFANVKTTETRNIFLANDAVRSSTQMITIFSDQLPWTGLVERLASFVVLSFVHLHVSEGETWIRRFLQRFIEGEGFPALRHIVFFYQDHDTSDISDKYHDLACERTEIKGVSPAQTLIPICIRKTQRFLAGDGCSLKTGNMAVSVVVWKGANEENNVLPYRIALVTINPLQEALKTTKEKLSCAVRGCSLVKLGSCKSQQ
ncbi:hypothetical protein AAVH_06601 [Aphelenchoides avenae]|nr:hypothetical protein AAVH_06601 [Aphelenchus avenae]